MPKYTPKTSADSPLDVAAGSVAGVSGVNKFGRSTNVDNGVDTDIWTGSDTNIIWDAPTTARIHDIASTSASDTSAGAGARTIRIYGLTSWSADEVSEDITMNGITNVATSNSYVIIHRMKVLTWGATDINVGEITATAQADLTVTAQIDAGQGQTEMAIYGIPSTKVAYMTHYYASAIKAGTALSVAISVLINVDPGTELTNFITKHTLGAATEGTSDLEHFFDPYFRISGPAIIKMQGNSSSNDTEVSAGFDLILTNS